MNQKIVSWATYEDIQYPMASRKRKEAILTRQDIPGRPGWVLESILQDVERILIIVRNTHNGSGFLIGAVNNDGVVQFDRIDELANVVTIPEMLIYFSLSIIQEKDHRNWPDFSIKDEMKNEFWGSFVNELPNVMITAQVLQT